MQEPIFTFESRDDADDTDTAPNAWTAADVKPRASSLDRYVGRGIYLSIDGVEYIDCASGTFNLSLGYSAKEITDAVIKQLQQVAHLSSGYTKEKSAEIFTLLKEHLPPHIDAFWFRDIIGSTANECAIRIAQKATGKTDVISLFLAHHGQTINATSVSGNAFRHKSFHFPLVNTIKVPAPDCANCFYGQKPDSCGVLCAQRLEDFIEYASSGRVAAFIIEPVLGNGGNIVPDPRYFKMVREICDKHGILIIADEVQTGFGRTGAFFASNGMAKDLKPDIIVFAKGAGGIGIPVAGVMMRKELDVLEPWEHSTTSGANPLALVALEETIKYFKTYNVLGNVAQQGPALGAGLAKLMAKYPKSVRNLKGCGLMFAFDMYNRPDVERLIKIADEHRLILRSSRYAFGTAVKVRPPLIVTAAEVQEIIARLDATLTQFESEKNA